MKQHFSKKILSRVLEMVNLIGSRLESKVDQDKLFQHHLNTIQEMVRLNAPIHFILPAFPAKSPNPNKTLGHLPDYGEVIALERLNRLCSDISEFYRHGAYVTLCSDGRVFSDLVEVPDTLVNEYTHQIRVVIRNYDLKNIFTYCLEDAFADLSHFDTMRTTLIERYGCSIDELRARIQNDHEFKLLFNGIHRFIFEDQLALHGEISKNQLREKAKKLGYSVIQRSNAWSALIQETFPNALRFSIHPQPCQSMKLGILLLESKDGDPWRTPWHSVPVFDGTHYLLCSRVEAEKNGAKLTYIDGKYPCYIQDTQRAQSHGSQRAIRGSLIQEMNYECS